MTADHLGSTRVVWGADGQIKKLYDYAPFGEEVGANYRAGDTRYPGLVYPRAGGQAVSMEFTGKERDAETGLDYFGARYMASGQGRFTSADVPFADQDSSYPQSWNLFAYVGNNPLIFTDPTGNCKKGADGKYRDSSAGACVEPGGSSVTVVAQWEGAQMSSAGIAFLNEMQRRQPTLEGTVNAAGIGTALIAAPVIAAAAGETAAGVWIIDGIAYRFEQLLVLGPAAWAKLVLAGKMSADLFNQLMAKVSWMDFAVGKGDFSWSPIHIAFRARGRWLHATGPRLGKMKVSPFGADIFAQTEAKFKFSLPILNPSAVNSTSGCNAFSCVTGAISTYVKGLKP